jgi:hypothetical protein
MVYKTMCLLQPLHTHGLDSTAYLPLRLRELLTRHDSDPTPAD